MNTSMRKKVWMMAGILLVCIMLIGIRGCFFEESKNVVSIKRGEYGEELATKKLQVSVGDEEMRTVEIQVSPKKYTKKQLRKKFEEAIKLLEETILGENESEDQITKNMNLPAKLPGYPFKIAWELSRYDVMDNKGQIFADKIEEVDPKREGVQVSLTGVLSYEEEEAVYKSDVLLFAPKRQQSIYEHLIQQVSLADEASREEEKLTLPTQVKGKPVTWKDVPDYTMEQLVVLGLLGAVLSIFWKKDQEKKMQKAKKEQMLMDYPEIIGQLTMLMEAGMTSKATWKKITDDYKVHKSRTGKIRPAYEEMLYTWQEMQSGVPESECYERFADRCELSPYMKMGALLSQNIRKGTKGLSEMLSMEAIEAMEERRNRAKRLGEEAGTKLMIPMLMMLIVVMIIVIVPAFMSIQI